MKQYTVAILAGGNSKRFGTEKAMIEFRGEPLIRRMVALARQVSPNLLVVVSDDEQSRNLKPLVGDARIVQDPDDAVRCALTGALTAFEHAESEFVQLLPVDSPLVNTELIGFLMELAEGHGAVVPSWPSGYIEPLHSVYRSEHAYARGLQVIESGKYRMSDLLAALRNVIYVSTEVLKQFDKTLSTFTNFNTPGDIRKVE
ncbi:MAG: molybdenum cofactor guanylyltransferase [Candidatus Thorarchaeota archaeon]|nr:MAG: hypothetical protein DRP09_02825 [Candidatus Thorarchaeota archaeon]RLI58608.1 MAG: hypothetical protein DRO87_05170 [Candidatus Thorarchaeota archaeon]